MLTQGRTGTKSSKPSSPTPISKLPSSVSAAFKTGHPMTDKPEILKCNHCKRAVAKHAMPKHIESCLNKKQEKQRKKKEAKDARDAAARRSLHGTLAGDSEDDEEEVEKGRAGEGGGSKKRKAGDVDEEGGAAGPAKKKKKKDDGKAKAPRPKAPVDVEKQCGVELPQGGQCARSLTCKSHSMGAKRAVRKLLPLRLLSLKCFLGSQSLTCTSFNSRPLSTLRQTPLRIPTKKPSQTAESTIRRLGT